MRSPHILQVSTADLGGGAERVAWNLHHAYHAAGASAHLAVGRKLSDDPRVLPIPNQAKRHPWARLWGRIRHQLLIHQHRLGNTARLRELATSIASPSRFLAQQRGVDYFNYPATIDLPNLTGQPVDLLHAHNLHGDYFDLRQLPALSAQLPTMLTLHDAWLLTGHCAHSLGCERWKTGCGQCPNLTIYPAVRRDATAHNWSIKRDLFAASQLYIASPSRWLLEQVHQSILAPAIIDSRVIPNGIDQSIYRPADPRAARAQLNLPPDARILLFAANGIRQSDFKDFRTMRHAIKEVAALMTDQRILLLALGETAPPQQLGPQAELRFIPHQRDEQLLARFYQASDIYVHAAKADTFPMTILEALSCGTPVVATAVGGIPEQVDDDATGFLTPGGDPHAMAQRIAHVLRHPPLRSRLAQQAARTAAQRFDLRQQAQAYLDWYDEILEQHRARRAA
jgi:glycosyltransferase involved in cell wall biosynthesis